MIIPLSQRIPWYGRGSWELTGRQAANWWWCWLDMDDVNVIRGFIQNTRVSVWRKIQIGAGISNIRKRQILWSCNTRRAAPWEADSQGGTFGVFSRCYHIWCDTNVQRQTSHWIALWLCATLLRQTEHKFLLQLGAGPGLGETSPQERRLISRNPATQLG